MALTHVVAYDIRVDDVRARVAAVLQAFGDRIQKSVFLLRLDADDVDELVARLSGMIDVETDSVYVLRQCSACWDERVCIGQAHPPSPTLYWTAF